MDMATLLAMFQGQGGAAGAAPPPQGMTPPQLGAPPPQQPGFGLGQQLVQPGTQPGMSQMAGQPAPGAGGMASIMQGLGNLGQGGDPSQMANLMKIAQLMQAQHGQQQGGMAPMVGGGMMQHQGMGANNTRAAQGYLAQGGGMTQGRGY